MSAYDVYIYKYIHPIGIIYHSYTSIDKMVPFQHLSFRGGNHDVMASYLAPR